MKTAKAFFLGIIMLVVVATIHVKAQPSDQPPSDQPLVIADQGLGFSLTLPGDLAVGLPSEFEGVNIIQIVPAGAVTESDDSHVPPTKVEISAERIADDMSYEEWQEVNQILLVGFSYDVQELSATATEVNGVPATYRELSSPEGVIRETEIFKNQTVYRVYGLTDDKIGTIYQAVLDGIVFSETNTLPVNDLPSLMELQSETSLAPDAPEAMPNLKLPYSGTKTITCAYYANDRNCHALSKIALDFNLNYEPVRATYSGRSYQISDSCGGKMAKLIYSADTRYATFYLHLNRHFFASGTAVNQGDYFAQSGATGTCLTGPHLHFALSFNGVNVKPEPMCGRTGFKRYQVHADCWPASEVFTGGSTQLFVSVAAVDLKVCASNLPGKLVYASLWRGPVSGYPEHSWLYSKQATSTCVWFYNMDGGGNTFAGVYYNTVASLRAIPANIASMQRSSCAAATGTTSPNGNKLFCDRRSR